MEESVGSKLLNEIERVSAKRERWRDLARADRPMGNFGPAIFLMTQAIEFAKRALSDQDPVACIAALRDLEGFDSED